MTSKTLQQEVAALSDEDLVLVQEDIKLRLTNAVFASSSIREATVETATRYLEAVGAEIASRNIN